MDADTSCLRRLEARLGCDPDEIAEEIIRSHLDDARELGENAVEELAAHAAHLGMGPNMMSAADIRESAQRLGFDAKPDDAVRLDIGNQEWMETEAWRIGEEAAQVLRTQEKLGADPICNSRLADLAGTTTESIEDVSACSDTLSFIIDSDHGRSRVVFRSSRETGRRFDLARLTGDRLFGAAEHLLPATQAYSYRQKAQRAFAAELLSPYHAVDAMLQNDVSEQNQMSIATHFRVSPMTIQTQLWNKRRIPRENAPDVVCGIY